MRFLAAIDSWLFRLINCVWVCPLLDWSMPLASNELVIATGALAIASLLIVRYRRRGLAAVLVGLLAVVVADALGERVLKPLIARPRPGLAAALARLLLPWGGGYSMPSLHATNVFAFATAVARILPRVGISLLVPAALVAYSRIYTGMHYPADVVAGATIGALTALAVAHAERHITWTR